MHHEEVGSGSASSVGPQSSPVRNLYSDFALGLGPKARGRKRGRNPVSDSERRNQAVAGNLQLQRLIDAVVEYAIFMIGLDGRVLTWNTGAARLKGYSPQEIIGQPFSRFYTAEDQAAGIPQKALAVAKSEGKFLTEGWRVRKDGTRFWALVVIDAIKDESGEVIGFAKVTRDITERQEAQHNLLESERRYRRLVEAVVDYAIFQLDENGIAATWNLGAQRIKEGRSR